MKMLLFTFTLLCSVFSTQMTEGYNLEVNLSGLEGTAGSVEICLMNDAKQFLRDCFVGKTYDFDRDGGLSVVFSNLPAGEYAIMAFHDEDRNGSLNCEGFFGMPSEPYAFSNNPSTFFGPPAHKKCTFRINSNKELTIRF